MSEPQQPPSEQPVSLPKLSFRERRVLGVMVEKAKTTPDTYPLSVNAIVTGANQKSNRDPMMNMSDVDVEDALSDLQKKNLAIKISGGRVIRWRHALYEALKVDKVELAVLAELLLRGPQTEGELRARAARMEPIDDLDALRPVLRKLTERGMVVYLTPEGRRGTILTHGLYPQEELDRLRSTTQEKSFEAPEPSSPRAAATSSPSLQSQMEEIRAVQAKMEEGMNAMDARMNELTEQIAAIKKALGI